MKKFLSVAVTIIAALVTSSSSLAKTEGSYVGVDLLRTKTSFYSKVTVGGESSARELKPTFSDKSYGLGLNYKYAFNFNNFFIAPGVIFEQNSIGGSKTEGDYGQILQTKNRFGLKSDFGYDFGGGISPYFTFGLAQVAYKTVSAAFIAEGVIGNANKTAYSRDWFYGAGVKFDLSKNVALNLEYNLQKFQARNQIPTGASYLSKISYASKLDVIKLGLSYNF